MSRESAEQYHVRRAEQHLALTSQATERSVADKHLDMASRHATLAFLCGNPIDGVTADQIVAAEME